VIRRIKVWSSAVSKFKERHPALKHGGYSATTLLPGEDSAAFEKLNQKLIAELTPVGALEDEIIADLARLIWRKQNLMTFRIAELAKARLAQIMESKVPTGFIDLRARGMNPDERQKAYHAADEQARQELGDIQN